MIPSPVPPARAAANRSSSRSTARRPMSDTALVLSLFPGIGLLDMAFEAEGFCVVRGPDVLWGGDVRRFSPPAGVFQGVIGRPPPQDFFHLADLLPGHV